MFRKSLFGSLTLMLAAVIAYLVIQGRREEKKHEQAARLPIEIVKQSKPTTTRIIAPKDLEILDIKMAAPDSSPKEAAAHTLQHEIVVRNNGTLTYKNIRVRVEYFGSGNRVLDTKNTEVKESVQPGQSRSFTGIQIEGVPAGVLKCSARLLSADLDASVAAR